MSDPTSPASSPAGSAVAPQPEGDGQPPRASRRLPSIVKAICDRRGFALTSLCDGWVLRIEHAGRAGHIVGYDFGLNSASARMLAGDKAACSAVLGHCGVPRVEHVLFVGPRRPRHMPAEGLWPAVLEYWQRCDRDVVCKPNAGTGGAGVSRARTTRELEAAVHAILAEQPAVCVSPYHEIDAEYRTIVLDGEVPLAFEKERPAVIGDGRRTVQALIVARLAEEPDGRLTRELLRGGLTRRQLGRVPAPGERLVLHWRHNLARGATARPLAVGGEGAAGLPGELARLAVGGEGAPGLPGELARLAGAAARAIGARFCSVDIVVSAGRLRVLEINSGVMMESFAGDVADGASLAERVYEAALERLLGEP